MARNSLKNVIRLINRVSQELPPEQEFLSDLKRSIEMRDAKSSRQPSRTYKPSSMNCIRQSYYQVSGVELQRVGANYNLVAICETGTDRHERLQNAIADMKHNGIDCEYIDVAKYVESRALANIEVVEKKGNETKLYHKKLNISFMCDGILRYHGHYYILEIKTEGSNKFWNRKDVDVSHHKQATTYSMALEIDEVLFVYVCRDTLDMKSFIFKVTDDMKTDIISYIETCDEYVKRHETPPIPENVEKKTCEYCSYAELCRMEG